MKAVSMQRLFSFNAKSLLFLDIFLYVEYEELALDRSICVLQITVELFIGFKSSKFHFLRIFNMIY